MEEGGIGDGCGDAVVAESVADNYRLAMVPGVLKCRGVFCGPRKRWHSQLVGQFIEVSPQNFIGRPNSEGGTDSRQWVIQYQLGAWWIREERRPMKSFNPLITNARRRNIDDVDRPSILAPSHQPDTMPRRTISPISLLISPPASPKGVFNIIVQSRSWSEYDRAPNPLLVYLHAGRKEEPGWLRIVENEYNKYEKNGKGKKKGEMTTQLSDEENNKLVAVKMELDRIWLMFKSKEWPSPCTPTADLSHAYGVKTRFPSN